MPQPHQNDQTCQISRNKTTVWSEDLHVSVLTRFVVKKLSLRPYYPIACASTCGRNATEAKEWDFDVDHPGIIFVSIRQGPSHVEYLYGLKAAKAADLKIRETEQSTTAVISGYTKQ